MGGLIMATKYYNIHLSYLANEPTLRSDANFIINDIQVIKDDYYCFDELFEIVSDNKVSLKDLDVFKYAEISNVSAEEDVTPVILDVDDKNELNANYFKKIEEGDIIRVQKNDILISKVRPYLKKIILIDDSNCDIFYTSAFIHIRPRKSPRLLFYLLKGHFIKYLNSISRQGKGYPTLSERDLHYMKFSKKVIDLTFSNEAKLLAQITSIEKQIVNLKKNRIHDTDVINDVFQKYFNWDFGTFKKKQENKNYITHFSSVIDNYDLRMSAKFHRPSGTFVLQDIEKSNCLRVKNFLAEPIVLGASVSPSDFDSKGSCYYISMASVKNYKVELDESQLLSDEYSRKRKNANKRVEKNDIIMTRSGAAIGKFALVEDDINAIHADFTMRIRLKNINPLFAYYYFRSLYFQYLIVINYKGLQNNNIFPNQVQEFPIPDISFESQDKIVENIKSQLDIQKKANDKITQLRNKIDEVIEKCIA